MFVGVLLIVGVTFGVLEMVGVIVGVIDFVGVLVGVTVFVGVGDAVGHGPRFTNVKFAVLSKWVSLEQKYKGVPKNTVSPTNCPSPHR